MNGKSYLHGYFVACVTFSSGLIVYPMLELVQVLAAVTFAGLASGAFLRARGIV